MELGEKIVTTASTGNAASSLACLAAGLPLRTVIFVPESAPPAKIAQLLVFGAVVLAVRGTYDDAFDLCCRAAAEYGWYNRSTGVNPFTREGKKTAAYELCEQLDWRVPDLVFVPVGDGNIISGLWKGFQELRELGLISRLPRLAAVQAQGSAAVKKALEGDGRIRPVSGKTVADSISVSLPRDGMAAVRAVRQSGGFAVTVSDAQILAAIPELARAGGVFGEPAAAAAWAGLKQAAAERLVGCGQTAAVMVTGNGLKDAASAVKASGQPYALDPDMGQLRKLVRKLSIRGG
jgi:threonine synthase